MNWIFDFYLRKFCYVLSLACQLKRQHVYNTTFLAIYHLSLVCGTNFTLDRPFRLFVFSLDSSSINWTRTRSIRTRTRTREFQFWWTRTNLDS